MLVRASELRFRDPEMLFGVAVYCVARDDPVEGPVEDSASGALREVSRCIPVSRRGDPTTSSLMVSQWSAREGKGTFG